VQFEPYGLAADNFDEIKLRLVRGDPMEIHRQIMYKEGDFNEVVNITLHNWRTMIDQNNGIPEEPQDAPMLEEATVTPPPSPQPSSINPVIRTRQRTPNRLGVGSHGQTKLVWKKRRKKRSHNSGSLCSEINNKIIKS
jgi:hypothetical protein